jgi:ubiquinone/menaquinone biosynthesis C-methylase UbiE
MNYSEPRPGEVCVDLGSGRGTDALRLAENVGKDGFVYGIDISEGMIQKAAATASRLGITNARFIQSPLEKIALADNTADLVISNCTINHASDKQIAWNEIFRILRKGGRFVISDIYATEAIPEEYRNDPVAVAECWAGSVTRDEYFEQLRKAGFSSIKILEESEPYEKGKVMVSSWTITGKRPSGSCNCGN